MVELGLDRYQGRLIQARNQQSPRPKSPCRYRYPEQIVDWRWVIYKALLQGSVGIYGVAYPAAPVLAHHWVGRMSLHGICDTSYRSTEPGGEYAVGIIGGHVEVVIENLPRRHNQTHLMQVR